MYLIRVVTEDTWTPKLTHRTEVKLEKKMF